MKVYFFWVYALEFLLLLFNVIFLVLLLFTMRLIYDLLANLDSSLGLILFFSLKSSLKEFTA